MYKDDVSCANSLMCIDPSSFLGPCQVAFRRERKTHQIGDCDVG